METDKVIAHNIHVSYVNADVARIFQNSPRASNEMPDFPLVLRRAVSIGRLLQDPLTELAALVANGSQEVTVIYY